MTATTIAELITAEHRPLGEPLSRTSFPCVLCPDVPMNTETERTAHVAAMVERAAREGALREAAADARTMSDPPTHEEQEWADWLDARANRGGAA